MSNRLESLNSPSSRRPPAAKPSLKFKPKVVVRKSKEERDKEPAVKQEHPRPLPKHNSSKGPRTRKPLYSGTHVVSAGPLAMGSVSLGNPAASKTGNTRDMVFNSVSPSPELFLSLKRKTKLETAAPSDDLDDDDTRINMNREYRFADEETVHFPVRPDRTDGQQEEAANVSLAEVISSDPSREQTPHFSREPSVKFEEPELELLKIKEHKAKLESKIAEPVDLLGQEESAKLHRDHAAIASMLSLNMANMSLTEPYFLLQLPQTLPEYTDAAGSPSRSGQVGSINVHKSGKISLNLGNDNNLSVSKGALSKSKQEVVMVEMLPAQEEEIYDESGRIVKGSLFNLGAVDGKLVAIPEI